MASGNEKRAFPRRLGESPIWSSSMCSGFCSTLVLSTPLCKLVYHRAAGVQITTYVLKRAIVGVEPFFLAVGLFCKINISLTHSLTTTNSSHTQLRTP